jgi:glycosyltransferase involved in cell wall biosynthesis
VFDLPLPHSDPPYPWQNEPVDGRLRSIANTHGRVIVYVYGAPDSSTFRYRVYNVCEALDRSGAASATYFFHHELPRLRPWLARVDLLVLCRVRWSVSIDQLIQEARRQHVAVAFDIDDLIYDPDRLPGIMIGLGIARDEAAYDYWFSYAARLKATARRCDFFISTNRELARQLEADFDRRCLVVPNFPGPGQREAAARIAAEKQRQLPALSQRRRLLGFFSGTLTHDEDASSLAPELANLLHDQPDVDLMLVGFVRTPAVLAEAFAARISRFDYQHYLAMQVLMGRCDVCLVPLVHSEFTDCKSEIKYVEASFVGTPVVASPSKVYRHLIEDGVDGFLARTGEWAAQVSRALSANAVAERAASKCAAHYDGSTAVRTLLDELPA